MSLTLGEKLRQTREDRGLTVSEVAEQTRISSLYLESIENDDYSILPGGIFNKGFVKSYAKFVGLPEAEAMGDYSRLISEANPGGQPELKVYRPEVLTDDRSMSSMVPTLIVAVIILALMTIGVMYGVRYLRQSSEPATTEIATGNGESNSATDPNIRDAQSDPGIPTMATLKVEFKALTQPVSLLATSDGKTSNNVVTVGSTAAFEPKESLKLSYSRSLAQAVQLTLNGKPITVPTAPLIPKRSVIEFEINSANLARIWNSGAIAAEIPGAETTNDSNIAAPKAQSLSTAVSPSPNRTTTTPRPSPNANSVTKPPANKPATAPNAASTPVGPGDNP